jgi:hypothetical protein
MHIFLYFLHGQRRVRFGGLQGRAGSEEEVFVLQLFSVLVLYEDLADEDALLLFCGARRGVRPPVGLIIRVGDRIRVRVRVRVGARGEVC